MLKLAQALWLDLQGRGALECPLASQRAISVSSLSSPIAILAASGAFLANRLTPAFAGIGSFEWRLFAALVLCAGTVGVLGWTVHSKHERCSSSAFEGVAHYTFSRLRRIGALTLLPVAIAGTMLSAYDLRYLMGRDMTLQGIALTLGGAPITNATVDVLNLDQVSLTKVGGVTDSRGVCR